MAGFSFFRFPYNNYYYNYYPRYNSRPTNIPNSKNINVKPEICLPLENPEQKKRTSKYNSFANINFSNLFPPNLEEPIVEILGIKLYLDDIIILGLLFFLYKEDVKDEMLFLSLILLLLT